MKKTNIWIIWRSCKDLLDCRTASTASHTVKSSSHDKGSIESVCNFVYLDSMPGAVSGTRLANLHFREFQQHVDHLLVALAAPAHLSWLQREKYRWVSRIIRFLRNLRGVQFLIFMKSKATIFAVNMMLTCNMQVFCLAKQISFEDQTSALSTIVAVLLYPNSFRMKTRGRLRMTCALIGSGCYPNHERKLNNNQNKYHDHSLLTTIRFGISFRACTVWFRFAYSTRQHVNFCDWSSCVSHFQAHQSILNGFGELTLNYSLYLRCPGSQRRLPCLPSWMPSASHWLCIGQSETQKCHRPWAC